MLNLTLPEKLRSRAGAQSRPGMLPALILELVKKFFVYYTDGVLFEHRTEILEDPSYPAMIRALRDSNSGPWIKSVTENISMSSSILEGSW